MLSRVDTTAVIAATDGEYRFSLRRFAEGIPHLHVVGEAGDGKEALALLLKYVPDIAVLDVLMPLCTGKEILEKIRERNLKTRVLLTTMYDYADYLAPSFWSGALGYLYRGDGVEEWIVPALRAVISGKPFVSPTPLAALRKQYALFCREEPSPLPLTPVELDILNLTVRGKSDKEMATELGIPVRTVEKRKARLRRKFGVNSTVELAVSAATRNVVERHDGMSAFSSD